MVEVAVFSRWRLAVAVARPPTQAAAGSPEEGRGAAVAPARLLCSIVNTSEIVCGGEAEGRVGKDQGAVVSMRLAAMERDRLAEVRLISTSQPQVMPPTCVVEVTVLRGLGSALEARGLEQQGTWRLALPSTSPSPTCAPPHTSLQLLVLTPSRLVVAWAAEDGALGAAIAQGLDDWASVVWWPGPPLMAGRSRAATASSSKPLPADGPGWLEGGSVAGIWACASGAPDSFSLDVAKAAQPAASKIAPPQQDQGAAGGGGEGGGYGVWRLLLKAAAASSSSSGRQLQLVGAPVALWTDVPRSGRPCDALAR